MFKSPPALRPVFIFGQACVLTAVVAACSSSAPTTSSLGASARTATAQSSTPAATPSFAAPSAGASVAATSAPASATAGCASSPAAPGAGLAGGSITVCPDAAPVGGVVHVTIAGCAPTSSGLPDLPAAGLFFLGPDSWLGTNGGGGAEVDYAPKTGHQATATFTIPATYTGGNPDGPYPTLATKPGSDYQFVTDPAGECNVKFTVLPS
jgi:hypothetical protein